MRSSGCFAASLPQPVGNHVKLHRSAQKSLKQGIVQFLGDAGSLFQPFFKLN
jgi:hypothetical protein